MTAGHVPVPSSHVPDVRAREASGTLSQPSRYVLEENSPLSNTAEAWIAAESPVEIRQ